MQPNKPLNPSEAGLHAIDYLQVLKNRWGVILLTFFLVLITAAVVTYVMPKKYDAELQIKVNPLGSKNQVVGSSQSALMTRQFFGTQFKIIESDENLRRAALNAKLPQEFGLSLEDTVSMLKEGLTTQQDRGTDLITIRLRMEKDYREFIKPAVLAIAEAYSGSRLDLEEKRREHTQKELKAKIDRQQQKVDDAMAKLEQVSKDTGLIYFVNGDGTGTTGLASRNLQIQTQLYDTAEKERDELKLQVQNLVGLDSDSLITYIIGLNRPESLILQKKNDQYKEYVRQREGSLANGLGVNHPQVKLLDTNIGLLREELEQSVVKVKDLLRLRLAEAQAKVQRLQLSAGDSEEEARLAAAKNTRFSVHVREYEEALSLYRTINASTMAEEMQENMGFDPIEYYKYPKEPKVENPASPSWKLNLILGAAAGIIFGVGIAFALELMDTSVKSLEDIERYLQVSVLAVVPKSVGILHKQATSSPDAEAYRILRTNIEFNRENPDDNAITVVSGGAGEGKSTTLVNLSYICAQGGYSTLMIDADLRRPRLHTFFDIKNTVGLTNYLTTDLALEDVILQTSIENLYFMPSGVLPSDAAGILNSRRMSEMIQKVKGRFDLVFIDSPPILGVSDASVLSSEVDLTMIVVQHRKLPRNILVRVKEAVENVGGTVLGVVLNNVDVRSDSQYQYYTSYYTYYAPGRELVAANPEASSAAENSKELY